jgi:hypothetical protein
MNWQEWAVESVVTVAYLACLVTIGERTFAHRHMWLGILGLVCPLLWLVGSLSPTRPGARP